MTDSEIQAFWSGVAAMNKGKIKVGATEGELIGLDEITKIEIDDILNNKTE